MKFSIVYYYIFNQRVPHYNHHQKGTPYLTHTTKTQFMTEEGSLAIYLKEIGKNRNLTPAEEAEVAVRIRQGDQKALERLVKANLRFVVSVARNYQNQGLPLSDLINEGNLGLIRAAKRFDEKKNFKFISYAVWWIRQAILQSLAEQSRIIKLPLNRVGTIHKIGKMQGKLEQQYRRMPNVEEIAQELQITENDVKETIKIGRYRMVRIQNFLMCLLITIRNNRTIR